MYSRALADVGASHDRLYTYSGDLVLPRVCQGAFWRIKNAKPAASVMAGFSGGVVAVVPARNEAELIGPVITSLFNQSVAIPLVLVDDESTDGTADVARRAAEKAGKVDALIVIQSKPLPAGWTGKLWSMHQGIERARVESRMALAHGR